MVPDIFGGSEMDSPVSQCFVRGLKRSHTLDDRSRLMPVL